MIGSLVLHNALLSDQIGQVVTINRRITGQSHPKLEEIVHDNFTNYDGIAPQFEGVDIAYYCIGVYTGQVAKDKFREITFDYTKAFAETLKKHSPNASFCFLSGQGADQTEKSRMMFAGDKGAAENFIISLKFPQTYIFRPGYIYPSIKRKEPNATYNIMRFIYPLFKVIYPNGVITSIDLARVIFDIGLRGGDRVVYENKDIKSIHK